MNPSDLMTALATHLATDSELQNWCVANLGKTLTVQLGVDENNPPAEEDYPIVAIPDVVEKRGEDSRYQVLNVDLACGLINAQVTEADNLKTYQGMPQVADLKHQIESACFRLPGVGCSVAGDSAPVSFYPLFVGYTTVEYKVPRSSRQAMR